MARFDDFPDVSFMGDITLEGVKTKIVEEYKKAYIEMTGETPILSDKLKAVLYADAQIHYQSAVAINNKAKQNLLNYSSGEYLDNLAIGRCEPRKEAEKSVVIERFTLSAKRERIVAIPIGTRFTSPNGKIYFETTEYAEIPPGELYVDVLGKSTTGGSAANRFDIGELNILVDPIAYVAAVENIEKPSGGADRESDDDFARRIFLAKNTYSTTGAEPAYEYYTKLYSTLIDDVTVTNPTGAQINVYILLKDRQIANDSFLEGLSNFLNNKKIKPLTDKVNVYNITQKQYDIDVGYTIYESDLSKLGVIQTEVIKAIEEYETWQCAKIGRDINHQVLISMMIKAGAATVKVNAPTNTRITPEQIAVCKNKTITYNGVVED